MQWTQISDGVHENLTMEKVQQIHQGRQRREPQTASSPTVLLPNPYKARQGLRRTHSGGSPTQRLAYNEPLRSHGYSSNRHVRENRNGSTWDPQTKLKSPVGHFETPGHRRKDLHKMGQGLSESVPFEVKIDDFPELTGIFLGQTDSPHVQKKCWGQALSLEDNSESSWKPNSIGTSAKFGPKETDVKFASPEITLGDSSEAHDGRLGSVISSWANIASQPPKKPISKETLKPAQVDEVALQEEGTAGKKKRKKRKKKVRNTAEDTEPGSTEFYQEPPKFEDEDEFPGLTPVFVGTDRLMSRSNTAKLCNDENQRQSIQQQPADQKNDKTLAKSPLTETMKAHKAEKGSGKKSKVPVQLDIGNMLVFLEKKQSQKSKQDTKPLTLSVGGGLPVVPKQQPVQKKPWLQDKIAHNPLDSTSPLVKKGKQREVPKAKKPTALKKVIMKEREERKQRRLLEEKAPLPENELKPAEEPSEEDNCEMNAADDETLNPIDELCDEPEMNGTILMERDEEEEIVEEQTTTITTTMTTTITTPVKRSKIHSRKFRDYCTQMLSKDVDECVTELLKELVRFQDRLYQKDPMKARMKRRIVMGLREVLKHLKLRKVKCVIISPNCERIQSKGGLDEALNTIIDTCREQGVPFVFALSRKALGRCVNKAVPVSLVGIFNFDGAQDIYHKMIELSSEARKAYEEMVLSLEETEESEPAADIEQVIDAEEPEYIKLWKKVLEKESNHTFVNFEDQFSSMHLNSECTEHSSTEDGMS